MGSNMPTWSLWAHRKIRTPITHPLGAVDVGSGYLALEHLVEIKGVEPGPVYRPDYRHVYGISPIFTVVDSPEVDE